MEDKELIFQIKQLKQIKPNQEWVRLSKTKILGNETAGTRLDWSAICQIIFERRYALSALALTVMLGGMIVAGDGFQKTANYVKEAAGKGMASIQNVKDDRVSFEVAITTDEGQFENKETQDKELPPAVQEYKIAKQEAKKKISNLVKENPSQASQIVKQLGDQIKEMSEVEKKVLGSLGVNEEKMSQGQSDEADKTIVNSLIKNCQEASLTDDQKADLEKVKALYENGDYGKALEYYLSSKLNQ